MNQIHLNVLIGIGDNDQGYVGNNSLKWGNYILGNTETIDPYLDRRLNRYELFDYCQNLNNDNINVLIAILSWGGMNRRYGLLLFNNLNQKIEIIGQIYE